jgi:anti-sigma regulatory factor (Ser/Thr protein kinase)
MQTGRGSPFKCEPVTLVFRARYSSLDEWVSVIEAHLPRCCRSDLVRAGIAEAMSNAIIHGALGISSALRDEGEFEAWLALIEERERDRQEAFVTVSIEFDGAGDGVVLEVRDQGEGFPWKSLPVRTGRGISIMHAAFDSVRWNDVGNTLIVRLTARRREP